MEKWIKREVIKVELLDDNSETHLASWVNSSNTGGIDRHQLSSSRFEGSHTVSSLKAIGYDYPFNLYVVESDSEDVYVDDYILLLRTCLWGRRGDVLQYLGDTGDGVNRRLRSEVLNLRTKQKHIWEAEVTFQRVGFWKKIIASSDKSLGLPDFSNSFYTRGCKVSGFFQDLKSVLLKYKILDGVLYLNLKTDGTLTTKQVLENWNKEQLPDLQRISREIKHVKGLLTPSVSERLHFPELEEWLEQNW